MNEDAALLRRYVEEDNGAAFAALVQKHVDLVYSSALRRTGGDAHRAAEVAQEVFTALARQARTLIHHPVLGAWLHAATRNIAVNLMLSDERRQRRQHIALTLETVQSPTPTPEWETLRPVLDAAIDELSERDRQSVVMRFLERRPFKEIGAALTISEDAARLRTDRALDKLRALLARRGITSTAAALGAAVSSYGRVGVPSGLAEALAEESLAKAAVGGTMMTAGAIVIGKLAATIVVSALAFAVGVRAGDRHASAPTMATRVLFEENRQLGAELQRLNVSLAGLRSDRAKLLAERATPSTQIWRNRIVGEPLPRHEIQAGVLYNFRQLAAAQDQFKLEHGHWPASIRELVGANLYVRGIMSVDGEDYTKLSFDGGTFRVTTASGITVAYATSEAVDQNAPEFNVDYPPEITLARALEAKVRSAKQTAIEVYRLANRGKDPPNEWALVAFFPTAAQAADFVEYLDAKEAASQL